MGALRITTGGGAAALRAALAGSPVPLPPTEPVKARPTLAGPAGKAWLAKLDVWRKFNGKPPGDASLDGWLIEVPKAHPIWHSYLLTLVHLRSQDGLPEPLVYLPGATHEIVLHVLNPDCDRNMLLATGRAPMALLTPPNFAGQFIEPSDDCAKSRVMASVQLICEGVLNPDTDARQSWIALYGDSMMRRKV
jgi:hypothetical protein